TRAVAILEDKAVVDLTIGLWGLISLAGVFASGRFYGHYFIPVLPALALLGARGIDHLGAALGQAQTRRRAIAVVTALAVVCVVGLVRFHTLTAALAYEALTGKQTRRVSNWGAVKREKDAAAIADSLHQEIGDGGYLYIWGYALDVYWRSGCRPASRFLTPYYMTGEFYPEVTSAAWTGRGPFWEQARARFIDDLRQTKPALILNLDEPIQSLPYPEIVDFINRSYSRGGTIGSDPEYRFDVYRLRARDDK
ncbi:MAG TPA: hypothetical protein VI756_24900, partial [Blastocatellia bacterium]